MLSLILPSHHHNTGEPVHTLSPNQYTLSPYHYRPYCGHIILDGMTMGPTEEIGINPFTTKDCSVSHYFSLAQYGNYCARPTPQAQ